MTKVNARRVVLILSVVLAVCALTVYLVKKTSVPSRPGPARESAQPSAQAGPNMNTAAPAPSSGPKYVQGAIFPSTVTKSEMDAAVLGLYREWKAKYLKVNPYDPSQYYVWYSDGGWYTQHEVSVSESHGHGMLLTALMAGKDAEAQKCFDGLYRFYKVHPSMYTGGLMAWQQADNGKALVDINGADSATDGDMDIAYALLLADRQWGSAGQIDYRGEALRAIGAVMQGDVNQSEWTLKLGDWANDRDVSTRPSDFMFDHLKAFGRATGDSRWNKVVDTTYALTQSVFEKYGPDTGLISDFLCKQKGEYGPAWPNFLESAYDGSYYYNACRVPWRVTTDYLMTGDKRALPQLVKLNAWIRRKAGMDPSKIGAGYRLDGTVIEKGAALCFTAPLMVSAMISPENQEWLNDLWDYNMRFRTSEELYYGNTLRLLSAVVVSGNWIEP